MEGIKYTLISDGSSDKVLMNVIKWALDDLLPDVPNDGIHADFRHHKSPPPKSDIVAQVRLARKEYPFDILFYHRDAESTDVRRIADRKTEIFRALEEEDVAKTVCVVPVKMMEAWLLINKEAILKAAGNRNYKGDLALPKLNEIETERDPKDRLHSLLMRASGLTGRRLAKFNVNAAVHLIAENIDDFKVLRQLSAFTAFEDDLKAVVSNLPLDKPPTQT